MVTKDGPRVLEYNVRFGDPETQSLLPLLESDLAEILLACTKGRLADIDLTVSKKSAATVVVAAGGYPNSYKKGTPMKLDSVPPGRCSTFPLTSKLINARCHSLPCRYCRFARAGFRRRFEHFRRPRDCSNSDCFDAGIGNKRGI
jgi:hypothetical protein